MHLSCREFENKILFCELHAHATVSHRPVSPVAWRHHVQTGPVFQWIERLSLDLCLCLCLRLCLDSARPLPEQLQQHRRTLRNVFFFSETIVGLFRFLEESFQRGCADWTCLDCPDCLECLDCLDSERPLPHQLRQCPPAPRSEFLFFSESIVELFCFLEDSGGAAVWIGHVWIV